VCSKNGTGKRWWRLVVLGFGIAALGGLLGRRLRKWAVG
jgi:hypothetical protein